jgi:hypothetical protein
LVTWSATTFLVLQPVPGHAPIIPGVGAVAVKVSISQTIPREGVVGWPPPPPVSRQYRAHLRLTSAVWKTRSYGSARAIVVVTCDGS